MRKCDRIVFLCFLACVLMTQTLFATTSGKISGIIRDAQTGEPLIGANIVIFSGGRSTSMGAATDTEGYYAILNVDPGVYEARVSYVGYASIMITDIQVNINLTTELNVDMEIQVIGQEEVVVVAQRSLLRDDSFASTHNVTAEEMQVQPIDNFMSIAQNQPVWSGHTFAADGPVRYWS